MALVPCLFWLGLKGNLGYQTPADRRRTLDAPIPASGAPFSHGKLVYEPT
jgi:hypothetical protein